MKSKKMRAGVVFTSPARGEPSNPAVCSDSDSINFILGIALPASSYFIEKIACVVEAEFPGTEIKQIGTALCFYHPNATAHLRADKEIK